MKDRSISSHRFCRFLPVLFALLLIAARGADAEPDLWLPLHTPSAGPVEEIVVGSQQNLLLRNGGGWVFRSDDRGTNWALADEHKATDLLVADENVFAASVDGGWISSDWGRTWSLLEVGSVGTRVYSFGATGDYILATTLDGLYRSSDGGDSWTEIGEPRLGAFATSPTGELYQLESTTTLSISADAGETWVSISGPADRYLTCVLPTADGRLFAGTTQGLFEYVQDSTWEPVPFPDAVERVEALLENPLGDLFIAAAGGWVYRSIDGGVTWTRQWKELSPAPNARGLALDLGGTLYVAGDGRGVYASSDNGETWAPRSQGVTGTLATWTVGSTLWASEYPENWSSNDRGLSWVPAPLGPEYDYPHSSRGTLFIFNGNRIERSTDGGTTWDEVYRSADFSGYGIKAHAFGPDGEIYISEFTVGIVRSLDDGLTWESTENVFSGASGFVSSLAVNGQGAIFASYGGVYSSSDQASSWTPVLTEVANGSTPDTRVVRVGPTDNVFAVDYHYGIQVSTDEGQSWEAVDPTPHIDQLEFNADGHAYAKSSEALRRSVDGGTTWFDFRRGLPGTLNGFVIDPAGYVYVSIHGRGLYRSIDALQGDSGMKVSLALHQNPVLTSYADVVLVANRTQVQAPPIEHEDPFATWSLTAAPLDDSWKRYKAALRLDREGTHRLVATAVSVSGLQEVVWKDIQVAAVNPSSEKSIVSPDGHLELRLKPGSVEREVWMTAYCDHEDGATIYRFGPPMQLAQDARLEVHGELKGILSVWTGDTWKRLEPSSGSSADLTVLSLDRVDALRLSAAGETPPTPRTTSLAQNYPNPFNPSTTIAYNLAEPAHVQLDVYTVRGRRVRRLVDATQSQGPHTFTWDGTGDTGNAVASGVYIYRIQAGPFTDHKRMVLLK